MTKNNPHKTRSATRKVRPATASFILLAIAALGFALSAMPAATAPVTAPTLESAVLSEMNIARAKTTERPCGC